MARAVINISCDPQLAIKVKELAEQLNKTESELCAEILTRFLGRSRRSSVQHSPRTLNHDETQD